MDNLLVKSQRWETMNKGEQGSSVYLLGLLVHKAPYLLFLMVLSFGRHLLWGGIPGLEHRQFRHRLLCIKQKGVRLEPNEKAD